MKRKLWLIPLLILAGLWLVSRLTGALQYYSVPTGSNEPTIREGGHLLASNLSKPKLLNFICYKQAATENIPGGIWVKRICGMPGDKVQIINGILFVNDRNTDSGLTLRQLYIAPKSETKKFSKEFLEKSENASPWGEGTDSMFLQLETAVYKAKSIKGRMYIFHEIIPEALKIFGHPWTIDNFGPVRVPPDKYFVLGDNRHQSADSRFLGFVDAKNYLGTVIMIF